jgi:hypothetical protein
MSDTPEPATEPLVPDPPPAPPARKNHHRVRTIILSIVLIPAVVIALWIWVAMGYTYASGDRAGYVQKISKKGWLCKTWEGELAMANLPGTMPQIFSFTVRDDSVAHVLEQTIGKQVSVTYEQHRGLPTSCFGETEYFISRVNRIGP